MNPFYPTISDEVHAEALKLAGYMQRKGYELDAIHQYADMEGNPLWWVLRWKNHVNGEKTLLPMRSKRGGGYELKRPSFGPEGAPLYRLHKLAESIGEPVYIVEGEKAADALASLGLQVLTWLGGSNSVAKADWSPLAGRRIVCWPDKDGPGIKAMEEVRQNLIGIGVPCLTIDVDELEELSEKGDAADWIKLRLEDDEAPSEEVLENFKQEVQDFRFSFGLGTSAVASYDAATAFEMLERDTASPEMVYKMKGIVMEGFVPPDCGSASETSSKTLHAQKNAADDLAEFAKPRIELLCDGNRDVYAVTKDTQQVFRIGGALFNDWLGSAFYCEKARVVNETCIREVVSVLKGLGREVGTNAEVFVRFAFDKSEGAYYVDLAETGNRKAVKIVAGSWEVVATAPVHFVRPSSMRTIPEPERKGDLEPLWHIANIPDGSRLLVITWLCECMRLDAPFVLLELVGEQGSAKSTTQNALRSLLDPNAANLRTVPKGREDLFISACENGIVTMENVSGLSLDIQDALCTLATGGGFAKRKLYTDSEEVVLQIRRPVVLNGITAVVTAQDLGDRTLSLELPPLNGRNEEESTLLRAFEQSRGRILGGLLDIFSRALAQLPGIEIPEAFPDRRLVSFLKLGMAVARVCGKDENEFLSAFESRRNAALARSLEGEAVAVALCGWIQQNPQGMTAPAGKLLEVLTSFRPLHCDMWPRSPRSFTNILRRLAPALRRMHGIECRSVKDPNSRKHGSLWQIKKRKEEEG